jgi:ABC-type uncharacterized transport system permease subunit
MTFGLIFRKIPKWSAVGGIVWGLLAGIAGRYMLGWDIGPQVYLSLGMTLGIFVTSRWTAELYLKHKPVLIAIAVLITGCVGILFHVTIVGERTDSVVAGAWAVAAVFGASLYFFAALFTKETDEERAKVTAFFKKLDTPVDVAKEVFGAGKSQVSIFPLVGITMIIMGGLLSLVFLTDLSGINQIVVATLIGMMEVFGILMWYFGKKSEIRASTQN